MGCATSYQVQSRNMAPTSISGAYHEVHKGETLWRIAQTYGLDVMDIARINNLSDATKINPGQRLLIPGTESQLAIATKITKSYEKESFIWPLEGKIISFFNQERYGVQNKGIDIKVREGDVIAASRSGRVVFCSDEIKGLGKVIIIDHFDGFSTIYARNSQNLVNVADIVKQNQVIARAGSTGRGTEPYLHFEIREGHKSQNPLYYLP